MTPSPPAIEVLLSVPIQLGAFLWVQDADWVGLRDAAIRVEAAGFDSLWISDHLIAPFPSPDVAVYEAWTTLAAIAATTQRLRLGLLVGNNLIRHPALVAKMAVTVDRISDGRLTLGLGAGWLESEIAMHGFAFEPSGGARVDRLEESITVIRGLTDGGPVDLDGAYYQLTGAQHRPLPVQARLPIFVGGNGRQRTLAVVARHADGWHASGTVEDLRDLDGALAEHCLATGRDPATIERMTHRWIRMRDNVPGARSALDEDLRRHGIQTPSPWLPLVGTPEIVADGLRPLIDIGFRHLLITLAAPFDHETIDRLPAMRAQLQGSA